jgi:negative regulator of sigma-B (phosphoserine phosphatase)
MGSLADPDLSEDWPAALEVGVAGTPIAGEERSGDLGVFAPYDGGALVAVIDGLGHGDDAADAAEAAGEVLRAHAGSEPQALLERCHQALRGTRGAVMTFAWFDLEARQMHWAGVGNVEARFLRASDVRGARHAGPVVLGGVVGFQIPRALRTSTIDLEPGDAAAFATDGIAADFSAVLEPVLSPQAQAERVLRDHGKGSDDALAVVVRWNGPG